MKTVRSIDALREMTDGWRAVGESIALVPTMGNLHRGHMSLVSLALEKVERVVVSVFVNPAQFGPHEDFDDYPRTLENDRRRLSRARADVLFYPGNDEIYPVHTEGQTRVTVPGLSEQLCGQSRPGHFEGVTSVVCRLLNIVQPDLAVFGQKDYQQLVIIRRMVADLHMRVRIEAAQTIREADGLAMSSRNQYLDKAARGRAPALYDALAGCRDSLLAGNEQFAALEREGLARLAQGGFDAEYFAVRRAGDLGQPDANSAQLVVLAAGRVGGTRLIDNVLVERSA